MIARYKPAGKTALALSLIIITALGVVTFTRASNEPATPAATLDNNNYNKNTAPSAAKLDSKRLARKEQLVAALKRELAMIDDKIQTENDQMLELRKKYRVSAEVADSQGASTLDKENSQHMQSVLVEAQSEYTRESRLYQELNKLSPDDLREALPTAAPDMILNSLLAQLSDAETKLSTLRSDFGEQHPQVLKAMAAVENLRKRVDTRVRGIMKGLEVKVTSLKAVMDNAALGLDRAHKQVAETEARYDDYDRVRQELAAKLDHLKKTRDTLQSDLDQTEIEAITQSSGNNER